jgi:hypothetical protein
MSRGSFRHLGLGDYLKGRYPEAMKTVKTGLARNPDFAGTHIVLAAACAKSDRLKEAEHSAPAQSASSSSITTIFAADGNSISKPLSAISKTVDLWSANAVFRLNISLWLIYTVK